MRAVAVAGLMRPTCLRVLAALLCAPASAQFGNLEVKWQMDESSGSKDATPSMGPPEPKGKLDGQTRATNLRGLSSEGLEGIVKSFGLSCDTCTNAGHWISRVRSGGVCILAQQPRRCLGVAQRGHGSLGALLRPQRRPQPRALVRVMCP